jgi:hypothetical protein
MPTVGERLDVVIDAQTDKAERKIKAFDKSSTKMFDNLDKSSRQSSKSTKAFGDDTCKAHDKAQRCTDNTSKSVSKMGRDTDGPFKNFIGNANSGSSALGGLGSAMSYLKFPAAITGINLLTGAIGSLTAGALGLVSSLGPASGLLGTLPGLATTAAQGVGVTMAAFAGLGDVMKLSGAATKASEGASKANTEQVKAARRTISEYEAAVSSGVEMTEQQTQAYQDAKTVVADYTSATEKSKAATDAYNEALKDFHPSVRTLIPVLKDAGEKLKEVRKTAQGGIFPGTESAVRNLTKVIPVLNTVVGATAKVMGDLIDQGGKLISSGPFSKDIQKVGIANSKVLKEFGTAALDIVDALRHVTVVAIPLTKWVSELASSWAENARSAAQAGRESGKLATFFEKTKAVLTQWGHVVRDLGMGLFNVLKAANPLGMSLLGTLEKLSAKFREWTGSVGGQNKLKEYFEAAKPFLYEVGGLLGDIAMMLGRVSLANMPGLSDMVATLRADFLPLLEQVFTEINKGLGPKMVELLVVVTDLFRQLAGTSGPLMIFVGMLTRMLQAVNWLAKTVPGFKEFLFVFGALKASAATFQVAKFVGGTGLIMRSLRDLHIIAPKATTAVGAVAPAAGEMAAKSGGSFAKVASSAKTHIGSAIGSMGRFVAEYAKTAGKAVLQAGKIAGSWVIATAGAAAKLAVEAVKHMATFVAKYAWAGVQALIHAAKIAASWIIAMGPIGWAVALVIGLVALIILNWDKVKGFFAGLWEFVKGIFTGAFDFIKNLIINTNPVFLLIEHWDKIKAYIVGAWAFIKMKASEIWNGIKDFFKNVVETIVGFFTRLGDGAKEKLLAVLTFFKELPGKIVDVFAGAGRWLYDIGKSIVTGLWDGIGGAINWLKGKWNDFVSMFPGDFIDGLQIRSPSKVFFNLASQIPKAIAQGIDAGQGTIHKSMSAMQTKLAKTRLSVAPVGIGAVGTATAGNASGGFVRGSQQRLRPTSNMPGAANTAGANTASTQAPTIIVQAGAMLGTEEDVARWLKKALDKLGYKSGTGGKR